MTLPDAMPEFPALPAQRLRLINRSVLKQEVWADLTVFDPDTIRDRAAFENPNQFCEGMELVPASDAPVIAGCESTSALPGKRMHGPGYVP